MPDRLSQKTLLAFSRARHPSYDRSKVKAGILHIGVGGFHRAHQAIYTEDVLASGDLRWGVIGANLRSTSMRDRLAPQDFLYTTCTRHIDLNEYRVVGALQNVLTLSQQRQEIIGLIASPSIKIITLTITEKGYCLNASGQLNEDHPDVRHDLDNPAMPVSALGIIAAGLKQRMDNRAGPITIISCDNLSENGNATARTIGGLLVRLDRGIAHWVEDHVQFPSTMVDRIVPKTTEADIALLSAESGIEDRGLVVSEPFSQWIIEDRFAAERPEWESAGAQIVNNVSVHEQMKLLMLNATHSALAYLGLLAGHEFIHEAMQDPMLHRFADYLLETEVMPVIVSPKDFDLLQYKQSILSRFANSQIQYRTAQVASDGSQKLIQRVYPSIQNHIELGTPCQGLMLIVSAWLRCSCNKEIAGEFADPGAEPIRRLSEQELPEMLPSLIKNFGPAGSEKRLLKEVASGYTELGQKGLTTVLQNILK
ncbi:MAG: mannitol dehydrogenase family protein [Gammaproteobacteria bacterium]|nr:mannitol dehydrogenase family protein [Gammaproteobacteria bacterium]